MNVFRDEQGDADVAEAMMSHRVASRIQPHGAAVVAGIAAVAALLLTTAIPDISPDGRFLLTTRETMLVRATLTGVGGGEV